MRTGIKALILAVSALSFAGLGACSSQPDEQAGIEADTIATEEETSGELHEVFDSSLVDELLGPWRAVEVHGKNYEEAGLSSEDLVSMAEGNAYLIFDFKDDGTFTMGSRVEGLTEEQKEALGSLADGIDFDGTWEQTGEREITADLMGSEQKGVLEGKQLIMTGEGSEIVLEKN